MKKDKQYLNLIEKVFDNNRFRNIDFEKFVNKTNGFGFIKNDIDRVLNDNNCTEDNLTLVKAYKDAISQRTNLIAIIISLSAFLFGVLVFIDDVMKSERLNDKIDSIVKKCDNKNLIPIILNNINLFFCIIMFIVIIALIIYMLYYTKNKKYEKLQFSYSYLINKMELRINEKKQKLLY